MLSWFLHPIVRFCSLLAVVSTIQFCSPVEAEEKWNVRNVAGNGKQGFSGEGGPALEASLDNPFGVVRGPDGDIWFCEYTGQRIRKIASDGSIRTIAGTGAKGFSGDGGPGIHATFNLPHEIRFDTSGNLFIVDMMNHAVRKITFPSSDISTIAGTGTAGYSGDGGLAIHAQFKQPHSIQFGPDGNLYVCDIGNHVIRLIDMKRGTIATFAGTGKPGVTPDGASIEGTPLKGPRSIDFDSHGDLWLATREGNQVFRFDMKARTIHHVAGTGESGFEGNGGPAKLAKLKGPKGIAIDREGHVWLADTESHSVRRIHAKTGTLELIAGTGFEGDGPEGDALQCKLARLHGIFVDRDGSILIGDSQAHRVRVLAPSKPIVHEGIRERVVLVAGGSKDAVDLSAMEAKLKEPFGTAFDSKGRIWIVEMAAGNRLLRIDSDGMLRHIAGKAGMGLSGDGGIGLEAQFNGPHNIAIGASETIFISDTWNGRVRTYDMQSNRISSLKGYEVPLDKAKGGGPYCVSLDPESKHLFVSDLRRVWKYDLEKQTLHVVAGNGAKGVPKDSAVAAESPLVDPRAVAVDRKGNVYILERGGNALRVVDAHGHVRTVINASGAKGKVEDATWGLDARMNGPKHLCIDFQDRVIIADAENHLVLRYDPATRMVQRIAGTGVSGAAGIGGDPRSCQLSRPHGVTIHPVTGELFVTDSYNNRILRIVGP